MIRNVRKSRVELRKFGLTVGGAFGLLTAVLLWRERPAALYVGVISAGLILCGLLAPAVLRPVERAWMKVAEVLGYVSTRIILSLAFYLVILPFGVLVRLMRVDLLSLKIDRDAETYWSKAESDGPRTRPTKPY